MEVVINIPDKTYKWICDWVASKWKKGDPEELNNVIYDLCMGVIKGELLPKEHGGLIDFDKYISEYECCGYIEDISVDYLKQITPIMVKANYSEHKCCYWQNNGCVLNKSGCPDNYSCDDFD